MLQVITSSSNLRQTLTRMRKKKKVGLVPTMGALHAGHLSLIHKARKECGIVLVTLFVNPLQFGPNEDLKNYPKNTAKDIRLCRRAGADILFIPKKKELLSHPLLKNEEPGKWANGLCGAYRPGHFRGVVRIVALFFRLIKPERAYFGQKDYQQLCVIENMARESFNGAIKIVSCPTIREQNGLACSSRNAKLNSQDLIRAADLYQNLKLAVKRIKKGDLPYRVLRQVKERLESDGRMLVEYVVLVDSRTLKNMKRLPKRSNSRLLLAAACHISGVRLIDNILIPF